MKDEIQLLMGNTPEVTPELNRSPEQLQELNDEIANTAPVVNRARSQGRFQGITNFLENPQVQEALLTFGRAFGGPRSETANTIAEGFMAMQQRTGNQAALEAAESGDPIAEAAGRFADAGLVAGLQESRQVAEQTAARLGLDERQFDESIRQFDESLNVEQQMMELRELGADRDYGLALARLELDEESFNARVEQVKEDQRIREELNQGQIAYWEALAAREQGTGGRENYALRTAEFLETLQEQEQNISQQINTLQDIAAKASPSPSFIESQLPYSARVQQFARNFPERQGRAIEEAVAADRRVSLQPGEGDPTQRLQRQIEDLENRLSNIRQMQSGLMATQASRLGAGTITNEEGQEVPAETQPGTSQDNPIVARNLQDVANVPEGSFVIFQGRLLRVDGPDSFTEIEQTEE